MMQRAESIHHIPNKVGPDVKLGQERAPSYPVQGDFVLVNAIIKPESGGYETYVEWTVNGQAMQPVKGMYINDYADNIRYYRFELGMFNEGDLVKYRIKADNEDDTVSSREFSFKVYNKYMAEGLDSVEPVSGGLKLQFSGKGNCTFPLLYLCFENGNLKITITSSCDFENNSSAVVSSRQGDKTYVCQDKVSGKKAVIDCNASKIYIKDENDNTLLESYGGPVGFLSFIGSSDGQIHSLELNFKVSSNDYFGFGEKFDSLNQKGLKPKTYVFNQPCNQNEKTYIPIPFFFTEKSYGMFVDTSYQVDFELAADRHDLLKISSRTNPDKPCLDLYVFFGQPKGILQKFLGVTGAPKLPQKWVFGPWISSNGWNTQKETMRQIALMNKHEIPSTVVVLEAWSDEHTFYLFNDSVYETVDGGEALRYKDLRFSDDGRWPDPKGMADYMHENNLKLVLWQIPVIKHKSNPTLVQHMSDRRYAIDEKLCITYSDGTPYVINYDWFSGSMMPDFTNPATRKWWAQKRKYLVEDIGVDGFKTDGGEFIFDDDVVFYNGEDGAQVRNKYPEYYISTYHEYMKEVVTFSRAGSTRSQRYPIYWSGDQGSTFREFRSLIRASLSINISGNPFCGLDLAGFSGEIPTPELFIRGAQFAAFSPVMQFHSESSNDRSPWNMAERTGEKRILDIYRKLARVRMNCIPYIYNEARNVSQNSEPFMRPLFIDNPEDSNAYGSEFEYMFGRSLLVAPITEEGIWQRDIYLPKGEWIDFWNGNVYEGNSSMRYTCSLDIIPVFMKRGSIIPLNLNNDFEIGGRINNDLNTYENLCFIMTGRLESGFEFCDDIGNRVLFIDNKGRLEINMPGTTGRIYLLSDKELDGYTRQSTKIINGTCYCIYEIKSQR